MMSGPCLCGDTQCPSCGPAQGNHQCICGEWADSHAEHEADGLIAHADSIMGFLHQLASGVTPLDYVVLRERARELLGLIKDPACQHDEAGCAQRAREDAEAEAHQYEETQRMLAALTPEQRREYGLREENW